MRIAEFAELTGVTPRRLRHFEMQGLLSPARDERGWRDYDEHDRQRVDAINQLVRAGIPTNLALQLLDVYQAKAPENPAREPDNSSERIRREVLPEELLAGILSFYRRIDTRARCLARNRDALARWLIEHGVRELDTG